MEKIKDKQMSNVEDDMDEIGSEEDKKRNAKEKLFLGCRTGDEKLIRKYIDREYLDILEPDDNKWSCLQWAVLSNKPKIVKLVYEKYKAAEVEKEREMKKKEDKKEYDRSLNDFDEAFKKPLNPADNGKYTPLHWSGYKGLEVISSVLLKYGCDPMAVDSYGDNALHQAAAGNHYNTFKLFMGLGIDLQYKNTRSHQAIDLTTNPKIQDLINKALKTKVCAICNKLFDFNNKRYLCFIKEDIICKNCCVIDYYYDTEDATEKDMRYCRCKTCQNEINKAESDLRDAIASNNLETLNKQFEESIKYEIDLHLLKEAKHNKDRLTREKEVTDHIDSLKTVDDHKTIIKSVYLLEHMLKDAKEKAVELDPNIIKRADFEKNRLLAEKELRQVLANITVLDSTQENLNNLNDKLNAAKSCNVAENYMTEGTTLSENIRLNLDANDILKKFEEYPIRVYPEVEEVDPKKKKKQEPPPKKKKKKKEPPFNVPEWAKELDNLIEKVGNMKKYVKDAATLGLNDDFIKRAKEQLARLDKKEIPFRKEEIETLKRLEEEKAAKKKKKK